MSQTIKFESYKNLPKGKILEIKIGETDLYGWIVPDRLDKIPESIFNAKLTDTIYFKKVTNLKEFVEKDILEAEIILLPTYGIKSENFNILNVTDINVN